MSDKNPQGKFSLQDELKKRKTQEIQKAIEDRKRTTLSGTGPLSSTDTTGEKRGTEPLPDPNAPKRSSGSIPTPGPERPSGSIATPNVDAKRATTTTPGTGEQKRTSGSIRTPNSDIRRATQTTSAPNRATQVAQAAPISQSIPAVKPGTALSKVLNRRSTIILIAAILIVGILLGTVLIATTSQPAADVNISENLTPVQLPTTSVQGLFTYLQSMGINIRDVRQLNPQDGGWKAQEEVEFTVFNAGAQGRFIMLSYSDKTQRTRDIMVADINPRFKNWKVWPVSNAILLAAPGNDPALMNTVNSHLVSYLIAPAVPGLPTATPMPTVPPTATK